MRNPTLLAVCMHEAGHAIAQLATGPAPWIDYIEVDRPDDRQLGIVHTEALWQPSYMRDAGAPGEIIGQWRRLAARDIVIFLAGPIAELRWRRHTRTQLQIGAVEMSWNCFGLEEPGPRTDFGMVRSRLAWLMPGGEQDGFERAWIAAEEVVAGWWREIVRLGRELHARGRIEDEDLLPLWKAMRAGRREDATTRAAATADWLED